MQVRRTSLASVAMCETVMLQTSVAAKMSVSQVRSKAREHCQDAKNAREAGRLPFDVTHRPGWKALTDADGSIHVPFKCSSCKDSTKCSWEGAASYLAQTGHFALRCTGQHDPGRTTQKMGHCDTTAARHPRCFWKHQQLW